VAGDRSTLREERTWAGLTPVERTRVGVEAAASVTGAAMAAAERKNGDARTVATRIRRIKYLHRDESNHHDLNLKLVQLSKYLLISLFFNYLRRRS
jgi:hypothetical protein